MLNNHSLGIGAGLGAALLWALSADLYRLLGERISPMALNLYKGVYASAALVLAILATGQIAEAPPLWPMAMLALSGLVGIGVGDTAFFAALNALGPRRTVLIAEASAPAFTISIAWLWLGEGLGPGVLVGIGAITLGVTLVTTERPPSHEPHPHAMRGIAYALVAAACQGIGAVLTRGAFELADQSDQQISVLWSTLIRLAAGAVGLLAVMPLCGQQYLPRAVRNAATWRRILLAASIGTLGGLTLQQVSFKNTFAGPAQTVMAMTAVFVLLIAVARGEHVGLRGWLGTVIAVAGVALLFSDLK
ncbi:EamA-like transporter family protein [Pirellulimonas nuda]|uniref:EamA-like transporter family protein n=1 Tax=Pirellulimonas nuda TaxID=2528009 RepID=A0A518DBF6_9BACT|nr:DMT family transporter [Pirellulimonas nuda]QDU88776.1 EamA-like transporter family protein [Pirellulimonas nuda]